MSADDSVPQGYDMRATRVAPPRWMVVAAIVVAAVAAALLFARSFASHVTGYVLGSFVTIGLVASFAQVQTRRRQNPLYTPVPWLGTLSAIALTVGVGAAAVHVFHIALELASR